MNNKPTKKRGRPKLKAKAYIEKKSKKKVVSKKTQLKTKNQLKKKVVSKKVVSKKQLEVAPKKKRAKKKRIFYWTRDTDSKIVEYNSCADPVEREIIFRKYLNFPLDKLAENIINRFKFSYVEGGFVEIKSQVVGFLIMNLTKYTPEKGKSFSYFSVIAKNYLILHNNIGYKAEKNTMYISDSDVSDENDANSIEDLPALQTDSIESQENLNFKDFTKLLIDYWEINIPIMFQRKQDSDIAYSILELIKRADKLENHSKKAAFVFLREMTDSNTMYISKVISQMKKKIMQQLFEYKTEGKFKDEPKNQFFTVE